MSLVNILLAATLFRTLPLLDNRFHPDEALYASFARLVASGQDPLLASVLVDKPPLAFYLAGLSLAVFGSTEFAARLPMLYASLVAVALTFALARQLYESPTAHLAAWTMALSPLAILFSITAFIDPLLTVFVLWGLYASRAARAWSAAWAFGLAFATKQTAVLFVPLALALALQPLPPAASTAYARRRLAAAAVPLVLTLAVTAGLAAGWDYIRQARIGFWEQGYADNLPGRLVRANEVGPRALAWIGLLHFVTGSSLLNVLLAAGLPALLLAGRSRPSRAALADRLVAGYVALYLAAYWLLAFNVWDRYLLPVVPLLALLLARVLRLAADRVSRIMGPGSQVPHHALRLLLPSSFLLLLLPPALTAARSGYPIGGDHGAYDGIDDAARYLGSLPRGSVVYDHWLSWEWRFYLFDGPVYVAWMATPEALAADLNAFGRASPRYLVVPSWESDAELRAAAAQAGFDFVPRHTSRRRDGSISFGVYQLVRRLRTTDQ